MHPQAGLDLELQKELAETFDWTSHDRPLEPLFESELPWLSSMREAHGDSATPDYTQYHPDQLIKYPEQHFAYRLIASKAEALINGTDTMPLLMIIDGAGGTGKSTVLHCSVRTILELAASAKLERTPVRVCAPTGSAASGIFGCTLHSFIRFNPSRFFEALKGKSETLWQEFIKGLLFIFIDERSLMSQQILVYLLARLKQGNPASTHPTGGVSIILLGDDFQLPPTSGGRLSDEPYTTFKGQRKYNQDRALARQFYLEHFQTCVQLTTNVRAAGISPEQVEFRNFQMDSLRLCKPTDRWYDYMKRFALQPSESEHWKRGFGIFASNERREAHNTALLALTSRELRMPIATINAEHPYGGRAAITATSKKAQGLRPTLHVCVGSRVSLNWNGWVSRGAFNGLHGIVVEIVYEPGKAPPQLPLVVFVACPKYRGPSYDGECTFEPSEAQATILGFAGLRAGQPGVIAVQPIGREFKAGKGNQTSCLRVQLPLELAWGITIHKSQSKTFGEQQEVEEVGRQESNLEASRHGSRCGPCVTGSS